MTLDDYLGSPAALSLTELSAACGVSKGRLSQLRAKDGKAPPDFPPDLALRIERATDGCVDAALLSSVIRSSRAAPARESAAA
jgi:hypothetical protein